MGVMEPNIILMAVQPHLSRVICMFYSLVKILDNYLQICVVGVETRISLLQMVFFKFEHSLWRSLNMSLFFSHLPNILRILLTALSSHLRQLFKVKTTKLNRKFCAAKMVEFCRPVACSIKLFTAVNVAVS